MAKYITQIKGNIDEFTRYLEMQILRKKTFSDLKHQFRTTVNGVRCCVQVFEGYTFRGGNWMTMDITTLEHAGVLKVVAITSGGSNGLFLKNWSWGIESEEKILEMVKEIIETYQPIQLEKE